MNTSHEPMVCPYTHPVTRADANDNPPLTLDGALVWGGRYFELWYVTTSPASLRDK